MSEYDNGGATFADTPARSERINGHAVGFILSLVMIVGAAIAIATAPDNDGRLSLQGLIAMGVIIIAAIIMLFTYRGTGWFNRGRNR